jgi:recombinational DNA repair protein RecT
MAKKTVVRRAFKYLPVSTEAQQAAMSDERVQKFDEQTGAVEAEYEVTEEDTQSPSDELTDFAKGDDESDQEQTEDNQDFSVRADELDWETDYSDAQTFAKELDINANQEHGELIDQISEELVEVDHPLEQ